MHYNNICYYLLDQNLQNSSHISCIVVSCCLSFLNIYMYIYKHIYTYGDYSFYTTIINLPNFVYKINASMTISN
jgi:hypothetical protein